MTTSGGLRHGDGCAKLSHADLGVGSGAVGAADFNMDVFIDFFDFDDFLAAYEAGNPSADFNGDNFIDFFDYDAFTAAYEACCGW